MKTNRRRFLKANVLGGMAAALPHSGLGADARRPGARRQNARYAKLDEVLSRPVLKRELFSAPIIIETLELLRHNDSFLCRVRSRDGAEGISVGHSGLKALYPLFHHNLRRFFIGKDARDLDLLLDKVFIYNFTPHMSGGGLGFLYMMHFVSVLPNAMAHHEFKGLRTNVQFECKTSPLKVIEGKIKLPTGPGLGVDIEPAFISQHQAVRA